jgi:hypothetical protein
MVGGELIGRGLDDSRCRGHERCGSRYGSYRQLLPGPNVPRASISGKPVSCTETLPCPQTWI